MIAHPCHALSGNAVKDFFLCFRANGPGDCESHVPKPQPGRPFDGDESNCRPVGPLSMIKTLVTRAAGPGYRNEWPIGPEPQVVASLSFLLFLQSGQFHDILREKNPSRRCLSGLPRAMLPFPEALPQAFTLCRVAANRCGTTILSFHPGRERSLPHESLPKDAIAKESRAAQQDVLHLIGVSLLLCLPLFS